MTKELFKEYRSICKLIEQLEEKEGQLITDTVSGSSPDYPYTQHPVSIKGVVGLSADEKKRLEKYRREKKEIEDYADEVGKRSRTDELLLRTVMKYGTDWNKIRYELGGLKSPSAWQMRFNRIF